MDENDIDVQDKGYGSDHEAEEPAREGWDDVDGQDEDEVEVVQAAKESPTPPEARNSDGFWSTDRVRRVMRRETAGLIRVPIGISDWRQVYPAIHREFAIDYGIRDTLKRIYNNPNAHATPDESSGDATRTI